MGTVQSQVTSRDIPVIGPWIGRTGRIQRIWSNPCAIEPQIYVQAFFTGIPYLLWSIYKPTPQDAIVKRGGVGHKKRRIHWLKFTEAMPGMIVDGRGIPIWFWSAQALKERIGWYFLLIDAAFDGVYYWSSLAYQWSGCPVPGNPHCSGYIEDRLIGPGAYTVPWGPWATIENSGGCFIADAGAGFPKDSNVSVRYTIESEPYQPTGGLAQSATPLLLDHLGKSMGEPFTQQLPNGRKRSTIFGHSASSLIDGFVNTYIVHSGSWSYITRCDLEVFATVPYGAIADP